MKKECIAIIIAFIFILPVALANTLIHDAWHPASDRFSIGSTEYTTALISQNTQLQVNFGSQYIIISNGTCQESDSLKFCFPSVAVDYHNITLDKDIYKAKLTITEITAELTIGRTIEKTTLLMGEESDVEVSIKNTGERPATEVYYEDVFFPSVDIKFVDGCLLSGTTIFWKGTLFPGKSQRCTFTIAAKTTTSFPSQGILTYFDGFRSQNTSSSVVQIAVPDHALRITPTASQADIGQPFNLTIALKNINEEYPITISSLTLEIPPLLRLVSKPVTILRADKTLRWQGSLDPKKEYAFTIVLEGERNGTFLMQQDAYYLINNIPQRLQAGIPIAIAVPELQLEAELPDTIEPGAAIPVQITLANPGTHEYTDIIVRVNGLLNAFHSAERIAPGSRAAIISATIAAPLEQGTAILNISAVYKTPFKQQLSTALRKTVLVISPEAPQQESPAPLPPPEQAPEQLPEPAVQPLTEQPIQITIPNPPWWITALIIILLSIDAYLVVSLIQQRKRKNR
ncbi:hypothetical protein HY491_00405 [Candidatus Woesearchaeota archaeon]|nr:hypothetical protein [Candidatus Woesearchaeota archaeon]